MAPKRLVIGALVAIFVVGSVVNALGPFWTEPTLSYDEFLADVEAGRARDVIRWRDQLQVTEGQALWRVEVPEGADLTSDLGAAGAAGGPPVSFGGIPDGWLVSMTPWVMGLMLALGLVLWVPAVIAVRRSSHRRASDGPVES